MAGHNPETRFTLLGVGAMNSPRYSPAGLQAVRHGVRRLVFAHIGRPTIAALDNGHVPSFGEIGAEGAVYTARDGK